MTTAQAGDADRVVVLVSADAILVRDDYHHRKVGLAGSHDLSQFGSQAIPIRPTVRRLLCRLR